MLVGIVNREDPDLKKQSDPGLCCLSRPFGKQVVFKILEHLLLLLHLPHTGLQDLFFLF